MRWGLGKLYGDVRRLKKIINVFFSYGFDDFFTNSELLSHVNIFSKVKKKRLKLSRQEKFRKALEELGPTFIKLGQLLSTRPDILSRDYIAEVKKLQDHTKPCSFDKIKEVIDKEMGLNKFKSIDEVPLASASLSQVHKAILKDGNQVVIKIIRPGAKEDMFNDLDIIGFIAKEIERIPKFKVIRPTKIVDEFYSYTKQELDLRNEKDNLDRFRVQLKGKVKIPESYDELVSENVLVMEKVSGLKLKDKKYVKSLLDAFFTQIFEFGSFHADPHQGNMLVTRNGKLILMDFGIVGRLTIKQRSELNHIMISVVDSDAQNIVNHLLKIGLVLEENINVDDFVSDIDDLLYKYSTNIKNISVGKAFKEILSISNKYHVRPPKEFVLLSKCLITLEGVVLELDPNFNVFKFARPYAKKYLVKQISPKNIKREFAKEFLEVKDSLVNLPSKLIKTIDRIEAGDFKVHFEHNVEDSIKLVNKTGTILALSFVLASYVIASTLFLVYGVPPFVGEYSLFGVMGLIFCIFFSLVLFNHVKE